MAKKWQKYKEAEMAQMRDAVRRRVFNALAHGRGDTMWEVTCGGHLFARLRPGVLSAKRVGEQKRREQEQTCNEAHSPLDDD